MFEEPNTIPTEDDMNAMYETQTTQVLIDGLRAFTDAANAYADDAVTHLGHLAVAVEEQDELLKTRQAVGEVVQIAGHQRGVVGPVGFNVMREKAA